MELFPSHYNNPLLCKSGLKCDFPNGHLVQFQQFIIQNQAKNNFSSIKDNRVTGFPILEDLDALYCSIFRCDYDPLPSLGFLDNVESEKEKV